jgi:hypothetical protein
MKRFVIVGKAVFWSTWKNQLAKKGNLKELVGGREAMKEYRMSRSTWKAGIKDLEITENSRGPIQVTTCW